MVGCRWTWLLAALLGVSTARAEPVVSMAAVLADKVATGLRATPSHIPAGGVLPLYGACGVESSDCEELLAVSVRDAITGTEVAGHIEVVRADSDDAWAYFDPEVPFVEGMTLLVTSRGAPTGASMGIPVAVGASTPLTASSVLVDARLSKQRTVLRMQCCPMLGDQFTRPRCLDVTVGTGVSFEVNVIVNELITTQYVFRLDLDTRDADAGVPDVEREFRPLSGSPAIATSVSFDGAQASYCYALRAVRLAGGDQIEVSKGCVNNDLTGLGSTERAPNEIERWLETCEKPRPDAGQEPEDAGGDDPFIVRDAGITTGRRVASGCQLATRTPASSIALALWSLLALVLCVRRQRSRAPVAIGTLCLCAAWCSSARAVVVPEPMLINVVPAVPADGVLVLYGVCSESIPCQWPDRITVTDVSTDELVQGQVSALHDESPLAWVTFTPDVPLRVGGVYRVQDTSRNSGDHPTFDVTVSAASTLGLADLKVTFDIRKARVVLGRACCPNLFMLRMTRCLETSVQDGANGVLRLAEQHPVATQWLYEATVHEAGAAPYDGDFEGSSLQSLNANEGWFVPLDGTASSYCYQIRAAPIVGGAAVVLDDQCFVNEIGGHGQVDRSMSDIERFLDTCEKLPAVADGGAQGAADQAATGDTASRGSRGDGAVEPPARDAGQGELTRSQGCELTASAQPGGAWWPALLAPLALRRRRRALRAL